jgi:hypothetical protein
MWEGSIAAAFIAELMCAAASPRAITTAPYADIIPIRPATKTTPLHLTAPLASGAAARPHFQAPNPLFAISSEVRGIRTGSSAQFGDVSVMPAVAR